MTEEEARKYRKKNRERKRRSELNKQYDTLRDMLNFRMNTAEKLTILNETIKAITTLREDLNCMERTIQNMESNTWSYNNVTYPMPPCGGYYFVAPVVPQPQNAIMRGNVVKALQYPGAGCYQGSAMGKTTPIENKNNWNPSDSREDQQPRFSESKHAFSESSDNIRMTTPTNEDRSSPPSSFQTETSSSQRSEMLFKMHASKIASMARVSSVSGESSENGSEPSSEQREANRSDSTSSAQESCPNSSSPGDLKMSLKSMPPSGSTSSSSSQDSQEMQTDSLKTNSSGDSRSRSSCSRSSSPNELPTDNCQQSCRPWKILKANHR